jgi:hypothetical protein
MCELPVLICSHDFITSRLLPSYCEIVNYIFSSRQRVTVLAQELFRSLDVRIERDMSSQR